MIVIAWSPNRYLFILFANNISSSSVFYLFDFDFLTRVARHPKLSIKVAIQTLDVLAKTYIEDIRHSMEALTPMLIMLSRYIDSDSMQEYLKELIKLFMTRLIQLENKQW